MNFRLKSLSLLLPLLAGCSANAPNPAVPASPMARGSASGLAETPDIRQSVRTLTSRAPEDLEASDGPIRGSRLVRVRQGYSEVIVAKTNPDGTFSTRCVDSAEGAEAFLNDTSPSSSRTKAAQ
jgi:hypothetical protein